MYVEQGQTKGEATEQERRDRSQAQDRLLGRVVRCDGGRAIIAASADPTGHIGPATWAVGRLISINLGESRTVGLAHLVETADPSVWQSDAGNPILVHVELVGEVRDDRETRTQHFDRGITIYPHLGAAAHRIRGRDLAAVYNLGGAGVVKVGNLSQDESIEARVSMRHTLSRHFAVVGTTGVGKSTAVSLLLHKAVETHPDLRVLILDPHNEFASAFSETAVTIDTTSLDLPFWLFRLEEFAEVLFRGRESVAEELDALRDLIPQAKMEYRQPGGSVMRRSGDISITADSPLPYRMAELLRLIDERIGMLDGKQDRPHYRSLRSRIHAAISDPRYRFMFASRLIEDTIHQAIGKIFRVPHGGRPVTCFQMSGMPSEVVNSVCSVLARLAFDLAQLSEGRLKLLVLCEEAHRYMPADSRLGFAPTRHALARIAKEGRKYGCYLGVVTQRPAELDPTILSQCSTIFAMRLANESDQAIIRSAISDSSASTLSFLSSMGQREAIAFGDGVATPMRMKFERVAPDMIPGGHAAEIMLTNSHADDVDLSAIVDKLRFGNGLRQQSSVEEQTPRRDSVPVITQRPSVRPAVVEPDQPLRPGRRFGEPDWRRPG